MNYTHDHKTDVKKKTQTVFTKTQTNDFQIIDAASTAAVASSASFRLHFINGCDE